MIETKYINIARSTTDGVIVYLELGFTTQDENGKDMIEIYGRYAINPSVALDFSKKVVEKLDPKVVIKEMKIEK